MSALAYLTLVDGSRSLPPLTLAAMMRCLQEAHFRMCEGQAFDIGFETATFVTFEEYVRMIEGKTAALLAVACELGAWAAGVSDERAAAYSSVGRAYGLAFQVRDDVLGTWGRPEACRRMKARAWMVRPGRGEATGAIPMRVFSTIAGRTTARGRRASCKRRSGGRRIFSPRR